MKLNGSGDEKVSDLVNDLNTDLNSCDAFEFLEFTKFSLFNLKFSLMIYLLNLTSNIIYIRFF